MRGARVVALMWVSSFVLLAALPVASSVPMVEWPRGADSPTAAPRDELVLRAEVEPGRLCAGGCGKIAVSVVDQNRVPQYGADVTLWSSAGLELGNASLVADGSGAAEVEFRVVGEPGTCLELWANASLTGHRGASSHRTYVIFEEGAEAGSIALANSPSDVILVVGAVVGVLVEMALLFRRKNP
jgi:hypothetical protein